MLCVFFFSFFFCVLSLETVVYLVAVVGPGSELHVTVLVVKGEPSDVYLACALEDARRDVQATAVMRDHHVCLERPVETLIRTNVSSCICMFCVLFFSYFNFNTTYTYTLLKKIYYFFVFLFSKLFWRNSDLIFH